MGYKDTIKLVPTQHLIDWLSRHTDDDLSKTHQHRDYSNELAFRQSKHVLYVCPGTHGDWPTCMFCDGGLSACTNCGAFEGMWPDDCPGESMNGVFGDAVYEGRLNYRDGYWRFECCKVMRHIYDLDNYMAEAGYKQDGVNAAGNPKWVKVDE